MSMYLDSDYQPQRTIWLGKPGDTNSALVYDTNAVPNKFGRKHIPAGTMLTAATDFRLDSSVVLAPTTDPSKAQTILLQDADITDSQPHLAPVVIRGDINRAFMSDDLKAVYTDANVHTLEQSLPNINVFERY